MADDSQYLTKYLIGLGYSVDKLQQKTFEGAAASAGKVVSDAFKVGMGFVAGFGGLLIKTVSSMNDLYQASIRANSSMLEMRAVSDAFGQIGGSADDMLQTLQQIGVASRENPAAVVFAKLADGATDATTILQRFLARYQADLAEARKKTPNLSEAVFRSTYAQYAEQLGISRSTLDTMLLQSDVFLKAIKTRMDDMARNHMTEKSMQDAAAAVRTVKLEFDRLEDSFMIAAGQTLPLINSELDKFNRWFTTHPDEVNAKIDSIGTAFTGVVHVVEGLVKLLSFIDDHKWIAGALVGARVAGPVGAVLGALGVAGYQAANPSEPAPTVGSDGVPEALRAPGPVGASTSAAPSAATPPGEKSTPELLRDLANAWRWPGSGASPTEAPPENGTHAPEMITAAAAGLTAIALLPAEIPLAIAGGVTLLATGVGGAVTEYLQNHDFGDAASTETAPVSHPPAAPVNSRADYLMKRLMSELNLTPVQAAAVTANVHEESGFDPAAVNPTSGAEGIAQWLSADRVAATERRLGQPITQAPFEDQVGAMIAEFKTSHRDVLDRLRSTRDLNTATNLVRGATLPNGESVRGYENPAGGFGSADAERRRLYATDILGAYQSPTAAPQASAAKSGTVVFNQTMTATINAPGGDAKAIGNEAGNAVRQANATALRNITSLTTN